jgi:hypothetical protein
MASTTVIVILVSACVLFIAGLALFSWLQVRPRRVLGRTPSTKTVHYIDMDDGAQLVELDTIKAMMKPRGADPTNPIDTAAALNQELCQRHQAELGELFLAAYNAETEQFMVIDLVDLVVDEGAVHRTATTPLTLVTRQHMEAHYMARRLANDAAQQAAPGAGRRLSQPAAAGDQRQQRRVSLTAEQQRRVSLAAEQQRRGSNAVAREAAAAAQRDAAARDAHEAQATHDELELVIDAEHIPAPRVYPKLLDVTTRTPIFLIATHYFYSATSSMVTNKSIIKVLDLAVLNDQVPFTTGPVQLLEDGTACEVAINAEEQVALRLTTSQGDVSSWELVTPFSGAIQYCHDAEWFEYENVPVFLPVGQWCLRAEAHAAVEGDVPLAPKTTSAIFNVTEAPPSRNGSRRTSSVGANPPPLDANPPPLRRLSSSDGPPLARSTTAAGGAISDTQRSPERQRSNKAPPPLRMPANSSPRASTAGQAAQRRASGAGAAPPKPAPSKRVHADPARAAPVATSAAPKGATAPNRVRRK